MSKDQSVKDRFIELRAAGKSYEAIAQELDTSKPTLISWAKEFHHEIGNLQALRLEEIQQKYFVLKESRIELLGERLRAVADELSKRDLKEIPTEKLFDIVLRYAAMLRQDETRLQFSATEDNATAILDTLNETVRWAG